MNGQSPEDGPLSDQAIADAQGGVADAATLWRQLVGEISRLGEVRLVDGGIEFRARYEQAVRLFRVDPDGLRDELVRDLARGRISERRYPDHWSLPSWLLDDLFEFIGSIEEPYDHAEVEFVNCRSARCAAKQTSTTCRMKATRSRSPAPSILRNLLGRRIDHRAAGVVSRSAGRHHASGELHRSGRQ